MQKVFWLMAFLLQLLQTEKGKMFVSRMQSTQDLIIEKQPAVF